MDRSTGGTVGGENMRGMFKQNKKLIINIITQLVKTVLLATYNMNAYTIAGAKYSAPTANQVISVKLWSEFRWNNSKSRLK